MAAASGSKLPRKSALKRTSCYDDYGVGGSSVVGKAVTSKRQKQLQLQSTQERTYEAKQNDASKSKGDNRSPAEAKKNEDQVVISSSPETVDSRSSKKQREAFVILIHTFNPESISEVTVGQAYTSLAKANAGVIDLFKRVKPEFADLAVDIGTATQFEDPDDHTYPDVRRRITPSGRVAMLWHTEEGRGELSVHKISIEE